MPKKEKKTDKERIAELEAQLKEAQERLEDAELEKAVWSKMVDIAEKELGVNIKILVDATRYSTSVDILREKPLSGVAKVCAIFGKQRQAYYKAERRKENGILKGGLVAEKVKEIRRVHPRMGCLKLHHKLKSFLREHGIKLGEKKFRVLMREHGLLVKIRRRNARTTAVSATFSDHSFRKYSNLVKDKTAKRAEEIWVTDITYIRSQNNFSYLSMVTDAYTKKILGWSLRNDLGMEGPLEAIRMALANRKYPDRELIHHSDRGRLQGIQYCSRAYIKLLKKNEIAISMTASRRPKMVTLMITRGVPRTCRKDEQYGQERAARRAWAAGNAPFVQ